jgi:hypothetical protein
MKSIESALVFVSEKKNDQKSLNKILKQRYETVDKLLNSHLAIYLPIFGHI